MRPMTFSKIYQKNKLDQINPKFHFFSLNCLQPNCSTGAVDSLVSADELVKSKVAY